MHIRIEDDFDLDKIINSGQCFRPCKISEGICRFVTKDSVLYMSSAADKNEYEVSCSEDEWEKIWKDYFDLDTDYECIRSSVPKSDEYMTQCAQAGKGIRILKQDAWEMLISFIISQRKSIPAIRTCIEKLCVKYGTQVKTEREILNLFPTPKQLTAATKAELMQCGLGYRTDYIMDAADRVCNNMIDLEKIKELDDESLYNELIKIKGVGKKVANCILLFAYHRTGRAPVDVWISRVIDEKYNGNDPFISYGEYAGIMQQYAFYNSIR